MKLIDINNWTINWVKFFLILQSEQNKYSNMKITSYEDKKAWDYFP